LIIGCLLLCRDHLMLTAVPGQHAHPSATAKAPWAIRYHQGAP
jgi:hypothetical protein